jgi:hypothetical protein
MSNPRLSYSSRKRLLVSVKVAGLLAALGLVTLVLEQPGLTASPTSPRTSLQESQYPTDAGAAPMGLSASEPAASGESLLRASASEQLPTYFPSQFAAPGGEVEAQPPTF